MTFELTALKTDNHTDNAGDNKQKSKQESEDSRCQNRLDKADDATKCIENTGQQPVEKTAPTFNAESVDDLHNASHKHHNADIDCDSLSRKWQCESGDNTDNKKDDSKNQKPAPFRR